jgi:hypothetical protein
MMGVSAYQAKSGRRRLTAGRRGMRIAGRGYKAGRFTYVGPAPPPDTGTSPVSPLDRAVSKASRFIPCLIRRQAMRIEWQQQQDPVQATPFDRKIEY